MFIHLLEEYGVRLELMEIARLLHVLEVPLLWDGKTSEEVTASTNLQKISFKFSEVQKNSWESFGNDYGYQLSHDWDFYEEKFLGEIKKMPIINQNDIERRLKIASSILEEDLLNRRERLKFTPSRTQSRIVMFELIRSCFACGGVTDFKKNFLQSISVYYDIEDESFNELLSQAAKLDKELKRSINLVLE